MRVAVLGSGAGALTVAADLARAGHHPLLADLPQFMGNFDPVRHRRGVAVSSDWYGTEVVAVEVAADLGAAVAGAELTIVVVPCFGHEPFAAALAPLLTSGQMLLFLGEGSGSIVARRALLRSGKHDVTVGEANTLPYLARMAGPGAVSAFRKSGGVFVSGIPSDGAAGLLDLIRDTWPYLAGADNVWDTVLLNYNAIDHVATMVGSAATLHNRSGGMLLWGEGATPEVVRVIGAVDAELFHLRAALGVSNDRRYREMLVAQGFAPDVGDDLFDTIRASRLVKGYAPTAADGGLHTRYLTEDVPYALVLASSIGAATDVATPVIDGLIAITSAMLDQDFAVEGRTLSSLGLGGLDAAGLRRFADTGEFPDDIG
ncbi:MAG: NAD/NADP octopine/nopaline dehydrogenase family protein [Acidimicrobiia bacterium]